MEMIPQLRDDLQLHSQLGGDFAMWFTAAKMEAWAAKWHSCAKGGFRSSFRSSEISHSLMQLSSKGHNFFISTPIHTPFKALDS